MAWPTRDRDTESGLGPMPPPVVAFYHAVVELGDSTPQAIALSARALAGDLERIGVPGIPNTMNFAELVSQPP